MKTMKRLIAKKSVKGNVNIVFQREENAYGNVTSVDARMNAQTNSARRHAKDRLSIYAKILTNTEICVQHRVDCVGKVLKFFIF